jgi:two-component system, chemotaxis family, chemotaxis protein CheY
MANSEQTRYSQRPRRILIVDDSSLVRLYYRETLEKAGFATDQAINGIEAMEKVWARPFWERWRSYAGHPTWRR